MRMIGRMKNRYDSADRWKEANPILMEGEFGVDEYGRVKAGDGITEWNRLPYVMESFRLKQLKSNELEGTVSISPLSDQVMYIVAEGNVVLNFESVYKDGSIDKLYFTQKKIYIENASENNVELTINNAEWANDLNHPDWGRPGMHLYILATWIGGRIILEVVDNDQAADNLVP